MPEHNIIFIGKEKEPLIELDEREPENNKNKLKLPTPTKERLSQVKRKDGKIYSYYQFTDYEWNPLTLRWEVMDTDEIIIIEDDPNYKERDFSLPDPYGRWIK